MKGKTENKKVRAAIYLRLSKPERLDDGIRNCKSKMVMPNIVSTVCFDKVMQYIDNGQNIRPTEATKGGAAVYARVANNSDGALKKQKAKLLYEASMIGDTNCQVYEEVASGISDKRTDRRGLHRLLSDIHAGKIIRVYIMCLDRIARNYLFSQKVLEEMCDANVELIMMK